MVDFETEIFLEDGRARKSELEDGLTRLFTFPFSPLHRDVNQLKHLLLTSRLDSCMYLSLGCAEMLSRIF